MKHRVHSELQSLTAQGAPSLSSGGTENGIGLLRCSQALCFANGEMQQRNGSSCATARKVTEHVNLKLSAAKVGVCVSYIITVNYLLYIRRQILGIAL